MQYNFGVGTLIGYRTDVANSTPVPFGVVQNCDLAFSFSNKELIGQYQTPVDVARAAQKITGKAQFARIYAAAFNNLFFNGVQATGGVLTAVNEAASIPTTPFQVTVSNAANFVKDLGVFFAATGIQLTRVASAPAANQYAVNEATGVYTFAAADTGKGIIITYNYNTASGAQKITGTNQLMGAAPTFAVTLANTYQGKVTNFTLNACVANKLDFPFKNQDYTIPSFEFEAFADAAGNLYTITTSE